MKKSGWVGVGALGEWNGQGGAREKLKKRKGKERTEIGYRLVWFWLLKFDSKFCLQIARQHNHLFYFYTPNTPHTQLNLVAEPQRQTSSTNSSFSVGNPISKVKLLLFFFFKILGQLVFVNLVSILSSNKTHNTNL